MAEVSCPLSGILGARLLTSAENIGRRCCEMRISWDFENGMFYEYSYLSPRGP
jgi:hypothetical protein